MPYKIIRNKKLIILGLIILLIIFSWYFRVFTGYPFQYSAKEIEAWVIDAKTKKPIQNVIVVAHWQLTGGFEGHNNVGQLKVMETTTDRNGRFFFPAWGPLRPSAGGMRSASPRLILFTPEHLPKILRNRQHNLDFLTKVRESDWHGKKIELDSQTRLPAKYVRMFSGPLKTSLESLVKSKRCDWMHAPRMFATYFREAESLEKQGAERYLMNISLPKTYCGNVQEILGRASKK